MLNRRVNNDVVVRLVGHEVVIQTAGGRDGVDGARCLAGVVWEETMVRLSTGLEGVVKRCTESLQGRSSQRFLAFCGVPEYNIAAGRCPLRLRVAGYL